MEKESKVQQYQEELRKVQLHEELRNGAERLLMEAIEHYGKAFYFEKSGYMEKDKIKAIVRECRDMVDEEFKKASWEVRTKQEEE